jgi:hypothetical protein
MGVLSKAPFKEDTLVTFHAATFWPKVAALLKMTPMSETAATFQPPIGWLNLDASRNIPFILATDNVLQPPMGWSKADAPANMLAIEVNDAVFHLPMGWSNAAAPENISAMFDTPTTFHLPMSALNIVWLGPGAAHLPLLAMSEAMLLTAAVFQSPMLPYVTEAHASSTNHEVTAVQTLPFVMHVVQTSAILHVATPANVGQTARKVGVHLA